MECAQEDCPHCNECGHLDVIKERLAKAEMERAVAVRLLEEHRAQPHLGTPSHLRIQLTEGESVAAALKQGAAEERVRIVRHLRDVADHCYGEGGKKALRDEAAIIEDSAR